MNSGAPYLSEGPTSRCICLFSNPTLALLVTLCRCPNARPSGTLSLQLPSSVATRQLQRWKRLRRTP